MFLFAWFFQIDRDWACCMLLQLRYTSLRNWRQHAAAFLWSGSGHGSTPLHVTNSWMADFSNYLNWIGSRVLKFMHILTMLKTRFGDAFIQQTDCGSCMFCGSIGASARARIRTFCHCGSTPDELFFGHARSGAVWYWRAAVILLVLSIRSASLYVHRQNDNDNM